MMNQIRRLCNGCGYSVTYCIIDDAHAPHVVTQFVAVILEGNLKNKPAVTDCCPKCSQELSLNTTTKPDADETQVFFSRAMSNGWVTKGKTKPGPFPGWKAFTYEDPKIHPHGEKPYKLIDTWYADPKTDKSVGTTAIYFGQTLLWQMHYGGWYRPSAIPTLMVALRNAYESNHFVGGRGPEKFVLGQITYENVATDASFRHGFGNETVKRGKELLGTHWYHCIWMM
jgi:hypothetical protein